MAGGYVLTVPCGGTHREEVDTVAFGTSVESLVDSLAKLDSRATEHRPVEPDTRPIAGPKSPAHEDLASFPQSGYTRMPTLEPCSPAGTLGQAIILTQDRDPRQVGPT
jgi:hypothetical protein